MSQSEIEYLENNVAEINIEHANVSDIAFIIKK